jgi:hypothetical protein
MPDFSYPLTSPERDALETSLMFPVLDLVGQILDEESGFWSQLDSNIAAFEKQVQQYVSSLPGWESIGPNLRVAFDADDYVLVYFVDADEPTINKFRELEYGDGISSPQYVIRRLSLNPDYLNQIYEQTALEVSL